MDILNSRVLICLHERRSSSSPLERGRHSQKVLLHGIAKAASAIPPSPDDKPAKDIPPTIQPLALSSAQRPPLPHTFTRRLLIGTGAALAVAFGGNLAGITSFVLGFIPQLSADLKLDVLYPVNGFKRFAGANFEFLYPASWVGDQTLLYRAAQREENERLLEIDRKRTRLNQNVIEPIVAFGPSGSIGELNVSVIVAPVPSNFRLEKLGGPVEAGTFLLDRFIISKIPEIIPTLLTAKARSDTVGTKIIMYYTLEFMVKGPSFLRHNIMVYALHNGKLVTLNVQTPENIWPDVKDELYIIADSFKVSL